MINIFAKVKTIREIKQDTCSENNGHAVITTDTINKGEIGYIVEILGDNKYLVEFDNTRFSMPIFECSGEDIEEIK